MISCKLLRLAPRCLASVTVGWSLAVEWSLAVGWSLVIGWSMAVGWLLAVEWSLAVGWWLVAAMHEIRVTDSGLFSQFKAGLLNNSTVLCSKSFLG